MEASGIFNRRISIAQGYGELPQNWWLCLGTLALGGWRGVVDELHVTTAINIRLLAVLLHQQPFKPICLLYEPHG